MLPSLHITLRCANNLSLSVFMYVIQQHWVSVINLLTDTVVKHVNLFCTLNEPPTKAAIYFLAN